MELPSTRAATTLTCLEKGSLFMNVTMLERSGIVKNYLNIRPTNEPRYLKRLPPRPNKVYTPRSQKGTGPMTLAAGFRCSDGVLLCAETMISGYLHQER